MNELTEIADVLIRIIYYRLRDEQGKMGLRRPLKLKLHPELYRILATAGGYSGHARLFTCAGLPVEIDPTLAAYPFLSIEPQSVEASE